MSITNNRIKEIKSLSTKKGRKIQGLFTAEGVRLLEEALIHNFNPEIVYFAESLLNDRGKTLVGRFRKKGVKIEEISKKQLEQICETKTPQGIAAVFKIRKASEIEHIDANSRKILWCDNISDPGNLGTLFRSALAFTFETVILSGSSAEIFSPKVVRASMGAVFGLDFYVDNEEKVIKLLKEKEIKLVAADLKGAELYKNLKKITNFPKLTMVVGNEAFGLSRQILEKADFRLSISHSSKIDSLNAAVAGSIMMSCLYKRDER